MEIRERVIDQELGIAAALLDWSYRDPAGRFIAVELSPEAEQAFSAATRRRSAA